MSLQEKGALAGLISVAVVYGLWFAGILPLPAVMVVAVHFVLLAATQTLLALRHGSEPIDERDRNIARAAASVAFFVALGGLFFTLVMISLGVPSTKLILVIMASFALADMCRYGLQFLGYKAG